MERVLVDLRHAVRRLVRSRGFTAVAVLTLALGIGGTTAIFSVVHGVLLKPLPYPEPDELVQVRHVREDGGSQLNVSYPNFADLGAGTRSFEAMGAYASGPMTVSVAGRAVRLQGAEVTAGFFEALGVPAALGRWLLPDETGAGAAAVAVVSHGYWQTRLGGNADLSRHAVQVNERRYQVVGVMPPGFSFPAGVDVWFPSEATLASQSRTAHNFNVIARLKDGVTVAQARSDLGVAARALKARYGDDTWMADATAIPLREELVGDVRPALLLLLGASGFLLFIACANVVNLLLARTAASRRDLAVRAALGAGHGRLSAHFLSEALVLCLAGGLLGALLAAWGVPALLALEQGRLPRVAEVGVNVTVLGFALALSTVAAMAIGVVPALRARRTDLRATLADGERAAGLGRSGQALRRVLTVTQIALTLVLLVGAALLAQSFLRLSAVDPGYRTSGPAVVMDLWLPWPEDRAAARRIGRFHEELLARIRALPGVEEAGGVSAFPLGGGGANGMFLVLHSADEIGDVGADEPGPALAERLRALAQNPERQGYAEFRIASEGYFRAMGIPLLRGRLFDERDAPDGTHVAVVSRSLAEERWPGEDPIGRLIEFGNMDGDLRPFTVIGVVGDVRERALDARPEPTLYGYVRQRPRSAFAFHVIVRGAGDPAAFIDTARAIAGELDPEAAVEFRTLEQVFSSALSDRKFTLVLMAVFGATALVLAVLGIYGVVSYLVSQRVREIGVRMALGASSGNVLRLFVRQGAVLALAGVACGLLAAAGVTRFLAGFLYEVSAVDATTYAAVALLLAAVAIAASWVPAWRAGRVDPMITLRSE